MYAQGYENRTGGEWVQADYAKPLADSQTGRFSRPMPYGAWVSVPSCYRVPQLTTVLSRGVLGGRSPVGITSAGGSAQNEAHEDVWCDREACKA
jgi:hypothetical protein